VPRFFFHVYDDDALPDEDGSELPDIYTAQGEAIRMSGEIMRDLGKKFWNGSDWRLEVTDAEGRILFIVRFSAEEVIPT
jgi:hypothetical protein